MTSQGQVDVIVVGSGPGGLGASVMLARAGLRTLLLEQHYQVGGYVTSFSREGFSFDPGAAILSGRAIRTLLEMAGMSGEVGLDLIEVPDPGLRLHSPSIDVCSAVGLPTSGVVEQLRGLAPGEASRIEAAMEQAKGLILDQKMQKVPMLDWLRESFSNPDPILLFGMISLLALILPPSKVPASWAAILSLLSVDLCYPRGGVISVANAYADAFQRLGGELRLSARVTRILTRGQAVEGVELEGGERIRAGTVVSDVGIGNTVRLVGTERLDAGVVGPILGLEPTLSCFGVFLGLDYVPELVPHTFSVASSNVAQLEKVYEHLASGKFFESLEDPIPLYLHAPSLEDPALAPPGHTSMTIFVWAPYRLAAGDWKSRKEHYADLVVRSAEARLLPGLSGHVVHREVGTPLTYERYVGKQGGAILGTALRVGQTAPEGDAIPISGLHCVGDTVAGSLAVGGSIMGGVGCAQRIIDAR